MIVAIIVSTLAVVGFALVLIGSKPAPIIVDLYRSGTTGVTSMLDPELDDDAKERAVRKAGFALFRGAGHLLWRFAAAIGTAAVVVYAADLIGLIPAGDTIEEMLSWSFLIIITLAAFVVGWIVSKLRPKKESSQGVGAAAYGEADRLVHALAFAGNRVITTSARVDNRLHRKTIAKVDQAPPVFIVSLARGGTTALLNSLHRLPDVATHEYGDMPFVVAPLTWTRLSGDRSGDVARQQRAHGDGMEIGLDSPEAFDEVLWQAYWPQKYRGGRIQTWSASDVDPAKTEAFERHHAKVVHLRRPEREGQGTVRYVSKNNANIGRLAAIDAMFPERDVVVALRRPTAHAASFKRQHENFLVQHAEDPFVRRYMRDIGHLEFGDLHQPIAFDGFNPVGLGTEDPDYWLTYWIAAFESIEAYEGSLHIVTQDQLRTEPQATMDALCDRLGLDGQGTDFASEFRAGPDNVDTSPYSPELVERAEAIYQRLAQRATLIG